jgi:hypothetical protein
MVLEAADWTVAATNVLVLARIDHAEPHWAADAAKHLFTEGVTGEITPRLREAMVEEWTWANYPMPWCIRSEIREVSNQAQKIHDDIRHGQFLIHAHAPDGHTTVAVGTYLGRSGKSAYLHGDDHLRQIADTFDSPAQALLAFEKVHGADMHPGPALLTDTERAAAEARANLDLGVAKLGPHHSKPVTVPIYLADACCPRRPPRRARRVREVADLVRRDNPRRSRSRRRCARCLDRGYPVEQEAAIIESVLRLI